MISKFNCHVVCFVNRIYADLGSYIPTVDKKKEAKDKRDKKDRRDR